MIYSTITTLVRCVHYRCPLNYIEVFSGLFVNIGELLCLRFSLLLPTIVTYHVGTTHESFPNPFDPMLHAGPNYCKTLAFTRHFLNAFRMGNRLPTQFLFIFFGGRVDALQRQLGASSRYLRNTTPKSFFMSALFTSLSSKLKATSGRLALLSYYCRFVATTKLIFVFAKFCICLNARKFASRPQEYVSLCLWKTTVDNYACLLDVTLLMFAPFWWYCKNLQLRANVYSNCCQNRLNVANEVRRIMPPNEFVIEAYGKVEVIEFFSESTTRQVVKYGESLLK
ncbi:hypothetical protein TcWFU_010444 [Taenia crassiceps]|uniref:Uncharacterized protein n=1 Tax=Taenia crassiceps TaxID=6207 RepID=A0ABR4QMN4_9CEST